MFGGHLSWLWVVTAGGGIDGATMRRERNPIRQVSAEEKSQLSLCALCAEEPLLLLFFLECTNQTKEGKEILQRERMMSKLVAKVATGERMKTLGPTTHGPVRDRDE